MKPAQTNPSWRERQVLALLAELARERCVAKRRFARLERFLDPYFGVVDGGAVRGALRRWKRRELLRPLPRRFPSPPGPRALSNPGQPRRLLQTTRSPPFVRDEGGPPRYHPCSLTGTSRRRTLGRGSIGPQADRLFCRPAQERILASSARPVCTRVAGLSLAPRVAVLLSFVAL